MIETITEWWSVKEVRKKVRVKGGNPNLCEVCMYIIHICIYQNIKSILEVQKANLGAKRHDNIRHSDLPPSRSPNSVLP